jgi:hypothetical protein
MIHRTEGNAFSEEAMLELERLVGIQLGLHNQNYCQDWRSVAVEFIGSFTVVDMTVGASGRNIRRAVRYVAWPRNRI